MTDQRSLEPDVRLQRLEHENLQLNETIRALRESRSWRITAPLRRLGQAVSGFARPAGVRAAVSDSVRFAYRLLPVPGGLKRGGKALLFRSFPRLFSGTVAYRDWQVFESRRSREQQFKRMVYVPPAPAADGADAALPVASVAQALPVADGRWEWSDYDAVRERIAQAGRGALVNFSPKRPRILDLREDQLEPAIRSLAFAGSDAPCVSILVPAWNNLKYTVECLSAIAGAAIRVEHEVIVVDNASSDGSAARLAGVPNLRVLEASENVHFLRNVNRALPAVRGRYLLLLNNDVQLMPGAVDAMVAAITSRPGVGAVGPKLVYPSGHLQEAGCAFRPDCTSEMIGLGQDPDAPEYNYPREVEYCSGACLLVDTAAFRRLGGFDTAFAPAYCEDSDLCLRLRAEGLRVLYCPEAVAVHHLSKTTAAVQQEDKLALVARNLDRFAQKWQQHVAESGRVRTIAFYLPQFHPIPENDRWWGKGFTEWRNVGKARPNFVGHYQPRVPADLGYYDLRVPEVMDAQAELARRYGIHGFCYYYYWFAGRRLLEAPLERMLATGRPDLPFCLCWANENWTRRWDGKDAEILMAQAHSDADDVAVIRDLIRFLRHPNYIRVNGRPLLVVYRVTAFPDFARTASTWRRICREEGVGEVYLALVESFEMVFDEVDPARFGCDAAVEFPPHGLAEQRPPSGGVTNPRFDGTVADYRDLAVAYCSRPSAPYVRFRGVIPGWDNTARRQDHSWCFENATPGAFEAWMEHAVAGTRRARVGDERLVFVNAWNEWAEGAYLEPDTRFGHTFLEAVRNAQDADALKRRGSYALE